MPQASSVSMSKQVTRTTTMTNIIVFISRYCFIWPFDAWAVYNTTSSPDIFLNCKAWNHDDNSVLFPFFLQLFSCPVLANKGYNRESDIIDISHPVPMGCSSSTDDSLIQHKWAVHSVPFWKNMDKSLTQSTLCNKHIAGIFIWTCSHIFPGSTVQVGRDSQSSGMQALVLEPEDRPTHALFSLNHKTRAMCLSMMSADYFILPNICIYPKKRIPLCPIRQCARCFWCVSGIPH